jgi:hypothetical protein
MNSLSYLSLVSAKSKKRPRSFSKWLSTPVAHETSLTTNDILTQMSQRILLYLQKARDIDMSLSAHSFLICYRRALYMGYTTKSHSDTLTDYVDLKYMEDIHAIHLECLALADHYQVYIPHREWMNIYEMIRDNLNIYDPDEEEEEEDEIQL